MRKKVSLFLFLVSYIYSAQNCNIASTANLTVSPLFLEKTPQMVSVSGDLNCPTSANHRLYIGYTIDWGDGAKGYYLYDKAKNDYRECIGAGKASCGENPFSTNYRDKQSALSAFSQSHEYKIKGNYNISISFTLAQKENGKTVSTINSSLNTSINQNPIDYCSIPKGYALFASNILILNDRVSCSKRKESSQKCIIGASNYLSLGVKGIVDEAHSNGKTFLRNNSVIYDGLWALTVESQEGATYSVKGRSSNFNEKTSVIKPLYSNTDNVVVEASKTANFTPGVYGDVTIRQKGTLSLQKEGVYTFKSLHFETGSLLNIASNGIVEIYTEEFNFSGNQKGGTPSKLFVGVTGQTNVFVNTDFYGSIWAPNAEITLGQYNNKTYTGTYFSKNLIIHQDSKIKYIPFSKTGDCK